MRLAALLRTEPTLPAVVRAVDLAEVVLDDEAVVLFLAEDATLVLPAAVVAVRFLAAADFVVLLTVADLVVLRVVAVPVPVERVLLLAVVVFRVPAVERAVRDRVLTAFLVRLAVPVGMGITPGMDVRRSRAVLPYGAVPRGTLYNRGWMQASQVFFGRTGAQVEANGTPRSPFQPDHRILCRLGPSDHDDSHRSEPAAQATSLGSGR